MISLIFKELLFFRKCFSRERTFRWFCLVVLGFIIAQDQLGGVTSIVRGLGLGDTAYLGMINFFNNSSSFLLQLENEIYNWILEKFSENLLKINDKLVFVIDAKKIPKEGKRMPGNVWQYQDSNSNSKPSYFTGQMFEVVGVLVKTKSFNCICLPFVVRLIDGFKKNNRDSKTLKERSADLVSSLKISGGILVADAWYAAKPFIKVVSDKVTIVTRVKSNAVARELPKPPNKTSKKSGRPPKYGKVVKLIELYKNKKITIKIKQFLSMDGSKKKVSFWYKDLLWPPVGKLVRFVGCEMAGKRIILMSTDVSLDPENIIQSYIYRTTIEISFWYSTQMLFNWGYRFWTKLDLVKKAKNRRCNLHFASCEEREKFWDKVKSYESFILIGFFVQNFLIFIIESYPKELVSSGKKMWLRSNSNNLNLDKISLLSARSFVRSNYQNFISSKRLKNEDTHLLYEQLDKFNSSQNDSSALAA